MCGPSGVSVARWTLFARQWGVGSILVKTSTAVAALCGLALRHIHRTWPTKQISLHLMAAFNT
jgi:hypothetical protein